MGPGHIAVAFAAKPVAPKAPLWALLVACEAADLPFLFAGLPKVGLGLWGSGAGLIAAGILEFVLLGVGIAIYANWWRKNRHARTNAEELK